MSMRIFKNKAFNRWAKEIDLSDQELKTAVLEINQGLYEANLGGQECWSIVRGKIIWTNQF